MISKKVVCIIGLILILLVGVCIYLIYNSKKDNFYNIPLPLPSVSGRYVRINAQSGQIINIAGVFIYNQNGDNLITQQTTAMANASMNSVYAPASNALDIIFATGLNGKNNVNRNINDSPLTFANYTYIPNSGTAFTLSQNWQDINANIAHSSGGGNPLDYWQYDFGSDINISAVEIYTRTDCCYERNTNLTVQVINNNGNITLLNTPSEFAPVIISTVASNQFSSSNAGSTTSTTAGATSTTASATSTTSGATSTTASATSTTVGATSTTAGATSTTAGATSTTAGATSTTAGSVPTTVSNNNKTSLTINSNAMLPSNLQSLITDIGFNYRYQGLANLQGNNNGLNDYIRYCGDDNGILYTALYGDTTQYSTYEKVVDDNGNPYTNGANMPFYSLYNPNNNRTINLNSSYAVGVYNRLNGTNYIYNKEPVIITPQTVSTTAGATSTTAGATSTTAGATSTTAGATSTTMGATSTTASTPTDSLKNMPRMPVATPGMITNLLNNGIGIDYLTSQGMGLNSAYRGPSTNIIQTNFSGTSNVYSPFLYYNKGSSEKFIGKLYHPYP